MRLRKFFGKIHGAPRPNQIDVEIGQRNINNNLIGYPHIDLPMVPTFCIGVGSFLAKKDGVAMIAVQVFRTSKGGRGSSARRFDLSCSYVVSSVHSSFCFQIVSKTCQISLSKIQPFQTKLSHPRKMILSAKYSMPKLAFPSLRKKKNESS